MSGPVTDSARLQVLIDEYQTKATREGFLTLGDASEALGATRDYALKGWLRDFILRWQTVEWAESQTPSDTSEAACAVLALAEILRVAPSTRAGDTARLALAAIIGSKA